MTCFGPEKKIWVKRGDETRGELRLERGRKRGRNKKRGGLAWLEPAVGGGQRDHASPAST
jgi:hypothetical protein